MVDLLDLTQGDSRNIEFLVIDDDTEAAIDITGAVVKWTAKGDPTVPNARAELFKTSYAADEIAILDAPAGQYLVQLGHDDSKALPPARLEWDTQITRPLASVTSAGSLSVTAGSASGGLITLTGAAVDLSGVRVGDILVPAGVNPGNDVRCTVEGVDAGAGTLQTDYLGWATEAGIPFEVFRGDVKTPIDGSGCLTILQGVTT